MNYGELIKQSFAIARHHRYLWFFGIFAGTSGSCNAPSGNFSSDGGNGDDFFSQASSADFATLLIVLGVVILLVVLVFVALSVLSQGALADSVAAIDRGGERLSFGSAWRAGLATFWRVLGEVLLIAVVAIGCLLAIGVPVGLLIYAALAGGDPSAGGIALVVIVVLLAIVALIAVFFPLGIISQLALRALIVGREGVVDALRTGWRLFRARIGTSLLLGLIQAGIGIAAALALFLTALVVGLVLFIPAIALGLSGYSTAAIVAGVVAGLLLLVPFLAAIGALGTFNHAFWTLAYLRLTAPPAAGPMQSPPPGPMYPPSPGSMGGPPPGPLPPPAAA